MITSISFKLPLVTMLAAVWTTAHAADEILISFHMRNLIETYGTNGTRIGTFTSEGLSNPSDMALDATGNVYVANFGNNTVSKYSPDGTYLGVFASAGMINPQGLAFDTNGNLYVSNVNGNSITEYSPLGESLGVFANSGLTAPVALAFGPGGNLYVANNISSTVGEYSPAGTNVASFRTGVDAPAGLAFDKSGNLYIANQYSHPSIEKYNSNGTNSTFVNGLGEAIDVVVGPDASIYVLDVGDSQVLKYSDSGILLTNFAIERFGFPEALIISSVQARSPALAVNVTRTNTLILSWSAATPFVAQQNSDLGPSNWVILTNQPAFVGTEEYVIVPRPPRPMFYRLAAPQ